MSLLETPLRERALWILKKDDYHVLVLTEDNTLLLSGPLKRKKQAKALVEAASDPEVSPATVLGDTPVVIHLDEVTNMRFKPSRGFIDLETNEAVHRLSGWGSGPTVVGGDRGMGYTMFGTAAIEDASRRMRSRRKSAPYVAPASASIEPQVELSDLSTISTFSYRPPAQLFSFILLTALMAFMLGMAALLWFLPDRSTVQVFLFGIFGAVGLLTARPPVPLEVDQQGIRWGRGLSRRDIRWDSISSFDVAKPYDRKWEYRNGLSLFVKSERPGDASTSEVAVSPTHFLSDQKLRQFLAVARCYRGDLALTPELIRPALSEKILPKRPKQDSTRPSNARPSNDGPSNPGPSNDRPSKKPTIENGAAPKPKLRTAILAILLGLAIPVGLIGLLVAASKL